MKCKEKLYKKIYGDSLYERRMKWTKKAIRSLPKGSKILDAGAGQCKNRQFCDGMDYVSQDFCQYDESKIVNKGDGYLTPSDQHKGVWDTSHIDVVSDIIEIPLPDASFDAIICTEVFEHIIRPDLAVKEFARLLKVGGALITTAPACTGVHMAPYFYYNGLSEFWYRETYRKFGFQIIKLVKNGNAFDKIAELNNALDFYVGYYSNQHLNFAEKMIMHMSAYICKKHSRRTRGSENFYSNEIMVIAKKI